jgi:hypothetical protein
MTETLQRLFGQYPELLLAWDDASKRLHETMVRRANKSHIEVKECELELDRATHAVSNCKHDAATAWMWGFRCAIEHYPELRKLLNDLLPTPDDSTVWDQVGV